MSFKRFGLAVCVLLLAIPVWGRQGSQNTTTTQPASDPQAVAVVQAAITAMGGNAPTDSTATGTVTVIAGSSTDQGTVRILTRGTNQTSEQIQTSQTQITEVFSEGQASQTVGSTFVPLSGNRAATTQSRDFPLPFFTALISNPDESLQFVGIEAGGTSGLAHIMAVDTFASQLGLQVLSDFTTTDIWIDAQSGLPTKIAWIQRDGGGASPRSRRETLLSSYKNFGGVLYPTRIQQYFNGTLWIEITIQAVTLNNGLSDTDFPVPTVQQ
jgi:hypothetical protein